MKTILKKILEFFKKDESIPKSKEEENKEIISAYNIFKESVPGYNKPNYELARKVFLDFNDFNQKNLDIHQMYLKFVPQSLLPYPKNYIKCAYYIFLEYLKKEKNIKMFKAAQEVGSLLFLYYPNWEKYQENLKHKSMYDDVVFKDGNPFNGCNPREEFKKLYGSYQISKEEYDNSLSIIDTTNEKLIYDFGILPEIEEDVDMSEIMKENKK